MLEEKIGKSVLVMLLLLLKLLDDHQISSQSQVSGRPLCLAAIRAFEHSVK